jgi:hypothetical protein
MKTNFGNLTAWLVLAPALHVLAATVYVDVNSVNPEPPYVSWATAARVIQKAVDAAAPGDEVLVTNGIYAIGGRAVFGALINRVVVDKPLTLRSANGPDLTIIQGYQVPGTTNGGGAIRCVYLTNGASLSGFTLTNGATLDYLGGDEDETGGGIWAASTQALVSNCVVIGNSAYSGGGGAFGGTINNCDFIRNTTQYGGGGACRSVLNTCTLIGNFAWTGGGAENCTLRQCMLKDNSAFPNGGGADSSILTRCMLVANSAQSGGGAQDCTLNACFLTRNSAGYGGAANGGTLNNCTAVGNSARYGGGVYGGSLTNCIVYFNDASDCANYNETSTLSYCCTTPQPLVGTGNLTADPQLASDLHLSVGSPCRGAGNSGFATGVDIDGESWATPPSIGCDEYYPGARGAPLNVDFVAAFTNVAVGQSIAFNAVIDGVPATSLWTFGDGAVVSNRFYIDHAWAAPGDYPVVLFAYNEGHPQGVNMTGIVHVVIRPVHYVATGSNHPLSPYVAWETAATNIQDAIDASTVAGALILVTNGIYSTGSQAGQDTTANRVALTKPVTVQSINGPEATVIRGGEVGSTGTAEEFIRCAYVGSGAVLSGFTLTNGVMGVPFFSCGSSTTGGGAWCEPLGTLTNCIITGNSACYAGGVYGGKLYNCALISNGAWSVGGVVDATLYSCKLEGNSGAFVGGVSGGTLYNCLLSGNSATGYYKAAGQGGGASGSTLYYCTVVSNWVKGAGVWSGGSAAYGGGAFGCELHNCTLIGNSSGPGRDGYGGAASRGILYNCALLGNSAGIGGGGVSDATLYNCTLSGNSAEVSGGAIYQSVAYNSIIFYNNAPTDPNWSETALDYCCTTPLPPTGTGNLALDPQLAGASHLSATSPCRGAGNSLYATGFDIDGEPWANPASIGCDEYYVGSVTGALSVQIVASLTNIVVHYPVGLAALIDGRTISSVWDLGDGLLLTNQPVVTHAWSAPGSYAVVLRAYNQSHPEGVTASVTMRVEEGIYYVAADSAHPQPPYNSWATAATNIQDAVDAVSLPAAVVLVTNGLYASGGRAIYGTLTNRVAVDKPMAVRSVNGPQFTIIQGYQQLAITNNVAAIRCVYLADAATLSGFTLTGGSSEGPGALYPEDCNGGGIFCAGLGAVVSDCVLTCNWGLYGGGTSGGTLNNCTLSGNSAESGGGASYSTLNNCTLDGNSATDSGGGTYSGTLNNCKLSGNSAHSGGGVYFAYLVNCTLVRNSAQRGGGAFAGWLGNCIVYYNTAADSCNFYQNQFYGGALNYCCTTPLPSVGIGNITNEPLFMDYPGLNLRLQSNSPSINAANNAYVLPGPDLDGNTRVIGAAVDIGAYEFQTPTSVISYAWLQQYGLPTDGSADYTDPDGDGLNNFQEWRCGTNPANASSALRMLPPAVTATYVAVTWQSVAGVSYFLERGTNLAHQEIFTPIASDILGQPGTTTYLDTRAAGTGPWFYRVSVRN